MPPETPIERLQARLATVTDDRKRPLMQVSVESGDLRWALAEITRLTADCARKDAALNNIHSWLVCWPIATPEDMAQSFEPMEALAASARGDGSGPRKIGAGLTAQERASREEDEEYEL